MASKRVSLAVLEELLQALGKEVTVENSSTLRFTDQGLIVKQEQSVVAGRPSVITEADIVDVAPDFVVVDDNLSEDQEGRLNAIVEGVAKASLWTISGFVDMLWSAIDAAEHSIEDAISLGDPTLLAQFRREERKSPVQTYFRQKLTVDDDSEYADDFILRVLNDPDGSLPVIVGGAGSGKTELCRIAAYRSANNLRSVVGQQPGERIGSRGAVAVRIPLRITRDVSLDAISRFLREEAGLDRIRNTDTLLTLLRLGRIGLILDGLDEIPASLLSFDEAFAELAGLAAEGLPICVTTRPATLGVDPEGWRISYGSNVRALALQGLTTPEDQLEFLKKYGANDGSAESARSLIGPRLREVPLMLLWSYKAFGGSEEAVDDDFTRQDRPASVVLLELVRAFCARDARRVGKSADEQMEFLTEFAYYLALRGPLSVPDAEILAGEEPSPLVRNPHALLAIDGESSVSFKDFYFHRLFLANALTEEWQSRAQRGQSVLKDWLRDIFDQILLDQLAADYLRDMVLDSDLSSAWQATSLAPYRYSMNLRRNLFALALAKVNARSTLDDRPGRSNLLREILGTNDLRGLRLSDLTVEVLDFVRWDLDQTSGEDLKFVKCRFPAGRVFFGATFVDCEVPGSSDEGVNEAVADTLRRWIDLWAAPPGEPWDFIPGLYSENETVQQHEGELKLMRRNGLALTSRAQRGQQRWTLTERGKDVLSAVIGEDFESKDVQRVMSFLKSRARFQ